MSSSHRGQSPPARWLRARRLAVGVVVFLLVTSALVIVGRRIAATATAQQIPTRLAFDNHGYPEQLIVQVWIDDGIEGYVVDAHCTRDHCETAPLMMQKGRHAIQLRVIIGDRMSAFTEATVDR